MSRRPKLVDASGRFLIPVVIDTREQLPFTFGGMLCDQTDGGGSLTVPTVRGTLKSGDYSLLGYETRVAVERKSLADLYSTLGQGRERFEREIQRFADDCEFAAVVVEADWSAVLNRYPQSLLDLRAEFVGRVSAGDTSAPWSEWVNWLDEAMPTPPPQSLLAPKTVYRTVLAWQQRYPNVHWWMCPNRQLAEVTTFRVLEKFVQQELSGSRSTSSSVHHT